MSQPGLFPSQLSASAPPEGFAYHPDAFSAAEHRAWLKGFESLPFRPFEFHGYLGKCRIVSFGWHYGYAGRAAAEHADAGIPPADARARRGGSPVSRSKACNRRWSPSMTPA